MSPINTSKDLEIKTGIQNLIKEWYELKLNRINFPFIPDHTYIPVSAKIFDSEELMMLTEACLEFGLNSGRYVQQFEQKLAKFLGIKNVISANSGSSANLLAIASLCSGELREKALKPGDEVITTALSRPTLLSSIVQYGLVPVFVDIEIDTYNIDTGLLENGLSSRTRAIFITHSMGNPFNVEKVSEFARSNNLWFIEDCSAALGSKYADNYTGTFSDIATLSFSSSRQIEMGEGGAVLTNNDDLKNLIISYKNLGLDCRGEYDRTGNLSRGHYLAGETPCAYSHIGYNLKITEMQAAVGIAQLRKLPYFVASRRKNLKNLYAGLTPYLDKLILPARNYDTEPCWIGFPIIIRDRAGFTRNEIVEYLESHKIGTGIFSAGNLLNQPAFKGINYRKVNDLSNTDYVINNSFWIGLHPGITEDMIKYMLGKISEFILNL